jgi:hypothetical protein
MEYYNHTNRQLGKGQKLWKGTVTLERDRTGLASQLTPDPRSNIQGPVVQKPISLTLG